MKPYPFEKWFKPVRKWTNWPPGGFKMYEAGAKNAWIHLRNIHGRELAPYQKIVDASIRLLQENVPIRTPQWYELRESLKSIYPEIETMIPAIKDRK